MELKEKILRLRVMKGMTQIELGKAVGVTSKSIQNYENGLRTPKKEIVVKLAEVLGVELSDLLSDEDEFLIEVHEKHGSKGKATAEKLIHNANALFAGGDISEEDKALVLEAIQESYFQAKLVNKKYTPKKYLKNQNLEKKDNQ